VRHELVRLPLAIVFGQGLQAFGAALIVDGLLSSFDMSSIVSMFPSATPLGFWFLFVRLALQGTVVFVGERAWGS
jgi:hypothetical protein